MHDTEKNFVSLVVMSLTNPDPAIPEEEEGHWSEDDEMFVSRKEV